MPDASSEFLDAPIPGQSLTTEPKSRPWEQPPKYTTAEEALDFYVPRLSDPEMIAPMVDVMERGTTVVAVAEMIQSSGVMQGLHSVDVGLIISPVLVELLVTQADLAEIEYKVGTEKSDTPDPSMVNMAMDTVSSDYFDNSVEGGEEEIMEEAPEVQPEGIMSRRMV
jgi:hypothetical protein|tara:strand:+ start:1142 stop:1642 length:501 start_codon:yes stop_codon:yes gene_type:complete